MLPRRRYRLFVVGAIVICFLLYRVLQNSWDQSYENSAFAQSKPHSPQHMNTGEQTAPANRPQPQVSLPDKSKTSDKGQNDRDSAPTKEGQSDEGTGLGAQHDSDSNDSGQQDEHTEAPFSPKNSLDIQTTDDDTPEMTWKNPPNKEKNGAFLGSEVHWTKPKEYFPVPQESIIPLPTGKPKAIPKIQYDFGTESKESQATREKRLGRVKAELTRAWSGYKKYAWMHDELRPVSAEYKDPFCGWAATLVDSLDTLWIAGMKDEFDEAVKAVEKIDFTWTKRHDIPVFETTIRYLGGLIAAFDVSGGRKGSYTVLLDKAVELAEILMGIFDTPNRMPVLYYAWKPDFTSQPRRAGRVGMAELATLSMEFTRLAQLTSENKYYDAVDRITNALVDMQEAGTAFPGLFPEELDASGCNKTATTTSSSLSKLARDQVNKGGSLGDPEGYVPGKTPFGDDRKYAKIENTNSPTPSTSNGHLSPRASSDTESKSSPPNKNDLDRAIDRERALAPFAANGQMANWDCVPQGLVPAGYGQQVFHMGGGQDSAYEYFPKQYLLLGGLEPKYQKLHEDTIDSVDKYLMYRPMIKDDDDWDVLFPAKVSTSGQPSEDAFANYEVTHLTCFIGGMYGLGGKIFGREKDIETAKKLTDGCVWAYQSMPSGLMPEGSIVVPCPTLEKCEFNETLWWDRLDFSREWREKEIARWEATEAELKNKKPQQQKQKQQQKGQQQKQQQKKLNDAKVRDSESDDELNVAASDRLRDKGHYIDTTGSSASDLHKRVPPPITEKQQNKGSELPDSLKKKLGITDEESPKASADKTKKKPSSSEKVKSGSSDSVDDKLDELDDFDDLDDLDDLDETQPNVPHSNVPSRMAVKSQKPLTHEEYVKKKISDKALPPGWVDVQWPNYILRPEAIESVWYMYRITGDPEWMEKGWRMFEATSRATRTQFANSAIDDVTREEPSLLDSMESFWIAETLKYYFLLFSEPDVISLDEWVLNTEAHPFKRPT